MYHVVRPGENLYRIGKAYGIPYQTIARVNGISDPARIYPGQRLRIPGARRQLPVDVIAPSAVAVGRDAADPGLPADRRPLLWPVPGGQITSPFGPRGSAFHDGIDIAAEEGTPIFAAAEGVVAYADELRGYGKLIILRHAEGFATVYAHNRDNLVREGQRVAKGAKIATVGATGRTSAPNLHFEVRKNNTACNPLFYLSPPAGFRVATERRP